MKYCNLKPAFEKDNIAIAFAVDKNYLPYLKYAIKSLVANRKQGNLDILVLHVGELDGSSLAAYFKDTQNLSIRFVDVSGVATELVANYVAKEYFTIASAYRLLLQDLLPNYERIIWLDTDIVVNGDLNGLFYTDLGGCWIGAVEDVGYGNCPPPKTLMEVRKVALRWARKYNFDPWQGYVNSGVLLMDLGALRAANVRKRLFEVVIDPLSQWPDQDALNVACRGHIKYLDRRWNWQACKGTRWEICADAAVVHFISRVKPWHTRLEKAFEIWWKYVDEADLLELYLGCMRELTKMCEEEERYYENKLRKMKHSVSYKLGRALTKPFRAIFRK